GHAVRNTAHFPAVGTGQPSTETWHFGVVLAFAAAGGLLGALLAPRLRRMVSEERILLVALVGCASVAVGAAFEGGLLGAGLVTGQSRGRSMRASHRPGASTSAGVGSSRSLAHSRSSPVTPARSTTPAMNALPRS